MVSGPTPTREELLAFMRAHPLAVEASVSAAGRPQAAVVGIAVSDRFELVFDTHAGSRKVANLRSFPHVAFVIGGSTSDDERCVQYEGVAEEPQGVELAAVKKLYFGVFPDGRSRQEWPGITYVRARPRWLRYTDFNRDPPLVAEFDLEALAPT